VAFALISVRLPAVRSYRELWLWLGGLFLALFPFLAAIAIAYFLKDTHYSLIWNGWMLAAFVSFLAAFTCFFGALKEWSFLPAARLDFPDIKVDVYGVSTIDTEHEAGTGLAAPARLRSFTVRLTNTSAEQYASLTALLYIKLIPGSWGRVGEAVCPPPEWTLPPSLGLNPIGMPCALSPGNAASGQLVYEIPSYYLDKIPEPMNARLELWDQLTGKRVNLPAEIGAHEKDDMVPSSGGAETLGPEYESPAGQEADAGQA